MLTLFISSTFLLLFFTGVATLQGNAEPLEDKRALLDFVSSFPPSKSLNWTDETALCDQRPRVVCNANRSRITVVRFHGLGLHGPVPPNTISRLSELRTLILPSNGLIGNFPSDLANLTKLIHLDLHSNNFSGPLPEDFSIWKNLTVVNLSNNAFNGSIPSSLSNLLLLNLSNNRLDRRMPDSVGPAASPEPSVGSKPLHLKETIEIYTLCGVSIMICFCGRPKHRNNTDDMSSETRSISPDQNSDNLKLVLFEGSNYRFDLRALLHSSTEILGSSRLGTSYKVVLDNSVSVVVKRLKDVGVSKGRFKQAMEMVQRIRHENVASLKGYYYSDDIKLMVYEYYRHGSLASILHGTVLYFYRVE